MRKSSILDVEIGSLYPHSKVNYNNTKTMSIKLFLCLYCRFWRKVFKNWKIDDLIHFSSFECEKVLYTKICFTNNNNDSRTNEMLYSEVRSSRVTNGKKGFRFNIWFCLKNWRHFEMEVCLLRGRGFLLINCVKKFKSYLCYLFVPIQKPCSLCKLLKTAIINLLDLRLSQLLK